MNKISDSGIEFIKQCEGFSGRAETVLDENEPTGGFGHKGGFEEGERVTREHGEELLREDVVEVEEAVKRLVPNSHMLSQNEFDAVISLVFNVGQGAFQKSKALVALNRSLVEKERFLFEAFDPDKGFTHAGGSKIRGLVNRRAAERRLFLGTI